MIRLLSQLNPLLFLNKFIYNNFKHFYYWSLCLILIFRSSLKGWVSTVLKLGKNCKNYYNLTRTSQFYFNFFYHASGGHNVFYELIMNFLVNISLLISPIVNFKNELNQKKPFHAFNVYILFLTMCVSHIAFESIH